MRYIRNKKITAPRAPKDLNMEGYASVPLQNGGKFVFPIAPSGGAWPRCARPRRRALRARRRLPLRGSRAMQRVASKFYVGECKTLRARINLHRNHSNPGNIMAPPLKVNQHLKTCADRHFLVFPFHIVHTNHQITRKAYEKHFQKIL